MFKSYYSENPHLGLFYPIKTGITLVKENILLDNSFYVVKIYKISNLAIVLEIVLTCLHDV